MIINQCCSGATMDDAKVTIANSHISVLSGSNIRRKYKFQQFE